MRQIIYLQYFKFQNEFNGKVQKCFLGKLKNAHLHTVTYFFKLLKVKVFDDSLCHDENCFYLLKQEFGQMSLMAKLILNTSKMILKEPRLTQT